MTIDITKFAADQMSGQGDGDSNSFSYSGATGYICSEPASHPHYSYNAVSSDLSSDNFEIADLVCSVGNSVTTNDDGGTGPIAKSCTASNTDFTLSGCQPKCAFPTPEAQETLNLYQGDVGNIPAITRGDSPGIVWPSGVSCSDGNFPRQPGCYQTSTGEIYPGATNQESCPEGHYWLEGDQQGNTVAAYCSADPNDLEMKLFGCEPGCVLRQGIPPSESMHGGPQGWRFQASHDPYISIQYNLDPLNFHVKVQCGDGFSDHTSDAANHTADACNPSAATEEDRQYVVSGCFPTCPEGQECISLSNTYNVADDDARPGNAKLIPTDYEHYKNDILPRLYGDSLVGSDGASLQGSDLGAAIAELKASLNYFRKYKVSETEIGIEAQIRCVGGSEGVNVCNLINVGEGDAFQESSISLGAAASLLPSVPGASPDGCRAPCHSFARLNPSGDWIGSDGHHITHDGADNPPFNKGTESSPVMSHCPSYCEYTSRAENNSHCQFKPDEDKDDPYMYPQSVRVLDGWQPIRQDDGTCNWTSCTGDDCIPH